MHLIAFTTNFRNFDNYADAFERVRSHGGSCELVALPWTGDPSHPRLADTGFPLRLHRPISALSEEGLPLSELRSIAEDITRAAPDFVMVCDMQSYPSNRLHGLLKECGFTGQCIGLQHGLFQLWNLYNDNFCADHLFCFGRRHAEQILPPHREHTHVVGLPKMDRLQGVAVSESDYVLFLPQRSPEAFLIDPTLSAFEKATRMPVVLHDHPQYPSNYKHRPSLPVPPTVSQMAGGSVIDHIRHARLVITLHSTAALEAMYLGKPVVLLPNAGLGAFENYPGISEGFSPPAIHAALQRVLQAPHHVARWLDSVMGGVRFDHAERVYEKLCELLPPSHPVLGAEAGMRALVLNDTRRHAHHLGCNTVMANLLRLCHSGGIKVVRSFTRVDAVDSPEFLALLPQVDAVIVNGEGTMHHDAPGARYLCRALLVAQRHGKFTALLNALWQDNDSVRECLPALDLAYARDARSAARLREQGAPLVLQAPDLSFFIAARDSAATVPCRSPGFDCVVHDSVNPRTTERLHTYANGHGLPFRVMQAWGDHAELGSHPVARCHYLDRSDFASPDTVHLGGRFHAACLALKHGCPFLALPSNTYKIEALLEDAGLPASDFLLPADWESHPPGHWVAFARESARRHATAIKAFRSRAQTEITAVFERLATFVPASV